MNKLLELMSTPASEDVTGAVPELASALEGRRLVVREMSGPERASWQRGNESKDDNLPIDANARLVAICLKWEDDTNVFSLEDVPKLMQASALVTRLAVIAGRVCGLYWQDPLKNGDTTSRSSEQQRGEAAQ